MDWTKRLITYLLSGVFWSFQQAQERTPGYPCSKIPCFYNNPGLGIRFVAPRTVHPGIPGRKICLEPSSCRMSSRIPSAGSFWVSGTSWTSPFSTVPLGPSCRRGSCRWWLRKEGKNSGYEHPLDPKPGWRLQSSQTISESWDARG